MLLKWEDLALQISETLTNREKILLSMTSKYFNQLKYQFIYREKINMGKILKLSYFDNFEMVEINDTMCMVGYADRIPKNAKFIYHKTGETQIPKYVTHLTFKDEFNQSIVNCIPASVTHLTFGFHFNQSIVNSIPALVTHLTFGYGFNQPIINAIPESVSHLKFGRHFDKSFGRILESVTHLTIGDKFSDTLFYVPFLTHLTLDCYYDSAFWGRKIPPLVTHLVFGQFACKRINKWHPIQNNMGPRGDTGTLGPVDTTKKNIEAPLPLDIPITVTHLEFNDCFSQPLNVPASVKEVSLSNKYSDQLIYDSKKTKIILRDH
jgi:hypothetical protein